MRNAALNVLILVGKGDIAVNLVIQEIIVEKRGFINALEGYIYNENLKIRMKTTLFLENYGLFSRKNIYTLKDWNQKLKEELRIIYSIEMENLEKIFK
jgi:hypothetical protein